MGLLNIANICRKLSTVVAAVSALGHHGLCYQQATMEFSARR